MGLFLPQTRIARPPYRSELLLSNPLNLSLCFAAVADSAQGFDLTARKSAPMLTADSYIPSPMGPSWKFTVSSTNSGLDFGVFNPITTSDGVGGGDFTILAFGNPASNSSDINGLLNQRDGTGSAEYLGLFANSTKNLGLSAGLFSLVTVATGGTNRGAQSIAGAVDGLPHVWVGRRSGTAHSIWKDGIDVTGSSDVGAGTVWKSVQNLKIGAAAQLTSATLGANCNIALALGWNRSLSNYEMGQIGRNPWQLFKATQPRFYFAGVASGAGRTGTIASTEASDVLAATGSVQTVGTVAATEAADVLAASGFLGFTGTIATTEAKDVLAATGKVYITGTASLVEAADVLAATGTVSQPARTGTIALVEAGDTFAGSGSSGATDRGGIPLTQGQLKRLKRKAEEDRKRRESSWEAGLLASKELVEQVTRAMDGPQTVAAQKAIAKFIDDEEEEIEMLLMAA